VVSDVAGLREEIGLIENLYTLGSCLADALNIFIL
jgi:hypothetical protein